MDACRFAIVISVISCVAGCGAVEEIEERGWVGGEFESLPADRWLDWLDVRALVVDRGAYDQVPDGIAGAPEQAVLVTQVFDESPLAAAGVEPGDIVLRFDGEPTPSADEFVERVEAMAPGTTATIEVHRFGESFERQIVVGRERFDRVGTLSLGLRVASRFDIVPNPDFDILGLLAFHWGAGRLERESPRNRVRRHNAIAASGEEPSLAAPQDWNFWLLILGVGRGRVVLSQETVPPANG